MTTTDALAVLEPIWNDKLETATRVRQRIEVVFDYAIAAGWRTDNPATAVKSVLPRRRGQKAHHPAIPHEELPAFIQALRASPADRITRLGLEFLILTAARSGEVRSMDWSEVDIEKATWVVPASRMKARKEHRVPLSTRAVAILKEAQTLGAGTGLVFPSRKGEPLSNMAFNMVLRRSDAGGAVPHGFRSTFKDWTLEQTSFSWAAVETALAHTVGSATEAAYARSDLFERRRSSWRRGHGTARAAAKWRVQGRLLQRTQPMAASTHRSHSRWESGCGERSGLPSASKTAPSQSPNARSSLGGDGFGSFRPSRVSTTCQCGSKRICLHHNAEIRAVLGND